MQPSQSAPSVETTPSVEPPAPASTRAATVPAEGYDAVSPWSAYAASFAAFAIMLVSIATAAATGSVLLGLARRLSADPATVPARFLTPTYQMAGMALMQVVIVALAVWCAGWFAAQRAQLLSLSRRLHMRQFLLGVAGMALLLVPYNIAVYALWPADFTKDLRPFADLAHSPAAWIAALVVAVGAPFSEELLFRGFLLPALARAHARRFVGIALALLMAQMLFPLVMRLIFPAVDFARFPVGMQVFGLNLALFLIAGGVFAWRLLPHRREVAIRLASDSGDERRSALPDPTAFALAALFSTTAWTLLHVGYSLTGLAEVFMIGLYFCWLLWRYGNLWLTIALHAFYNGLQFALLASITLPAP